MFELKKSVFSFYWNKQRCLWISALKVCEVVESNVLTEWQSRVSILFATCLWMHKFCLQICNKSNSGLTPINVLDTDFSTP